MTRDSSDTADANGVGKRIYRLTDSIDDCLHYRLDIRDLHRRMAFTACALTAERYGANLQAVKGEGYAALHAAIGSVLSDAEEQGAGNGKISTLLQEYSVIRTDTAADVDIVDNLIDWITEIFECVSSPSWHGEDVMGIMFSEFGRNGRKSDFGQIFTPEHIADFMCRILDVKADDYVLDAACGSGGILVKSMARMMASAGAEKGICNKSGRLFGIEIDKEIYALACANMLIHGFGSMSLTRMDTRTPEACSWIRSKQITKVMMNPPYENRYGCMDIVENVMDNVPAHTCCAFILPERKLEKAGKARMGRILSHHRLLKIIKLPDMLFPGVSIETSIFMFETGIPQDNASIFACNMESDGLETIKNRGRHDIHGRWQEIENHWVDVVTCEGGDKTCQRIDPAEHLSYQMPRRPFMIAEEDFRKTAMDYLMYRKGVDAKTFNRRLTDTILYSGHASAGKGSVTVTMPAAGRDDDHGKD